MSECFIKDHFLQLERVAVDWIKPYLLSNKPNFIKKFLRVQQTFLTLKNRFLQCNRRYQIMLRVLRDEN
jgi:hypothetical protein